MNYHIAFWVATLFAALFAFAFVWASLRALKTQYYNRELFKECLTSHKVRDEALVELNELKNGIRK